MGCAESVTIYHDYRFRCNLCDKKIRCDHMGRLDIIRHSTTKGHRDVAHQMKSQTSLVTFTTSTDTAGSKKTIEAELIMAVLTASSSIPLAFHDKLSPAIRSCFSDSAIGKNYHSASTKATCLLNLAVAPFLIDNLLDVMKSHPFSLSTDGSNDTGIEKMNPISIRVFDEELSKVVTKFLHMCPSTDGQAQTLFSNIDSKLSELLDLSNPWGMCTALGLDNTSVNIGVRNSIKSRVLQRNKAIYVNGCPCHIIHNAAQKGGQSYSASSKFDTEEFLIDVYFWFEHSTKRKNTLRSFCEFCDQDYRNIIKHVSTRWLSLEIAIERCLKQFPSLKSYFLSSHEPQARFTRLHVAFGDPMIEIHLLFFQSVLGIFTSANKFLQREEPLIHLLRPHLMSLFKKLLSRFVEPRAIAAQVRDVHLVDFESNQLGNEKLVIGFTTRQLLTRLLEDGSITNQQVTNFYSSVRIFYIHTAKYLLQWCPFSDELLKHATWVDFQQRLDSSFTSVEFFVGSYPDILKNINMDKLNEQFICYQTIDENDIPETIKASCCISDDENGKLCRMDVMWSYLKGFKVPGTNEPMLDLLFKVAEVILTIPHSNAGEERIFSYINKNKTPSRSSLSLTGTLSSIITVKTHINNPLCWKPCERLLVSAKRATVEYNKQHQKHV